MARHLIPPFELFTAVRIIAASGTCLSASALGQSFPGVFELSSLNGTNGFVINGADAFDYNGFSVASAGDVNGDGMDDLIIGAGLADPNANVNRGETFVVFGGPSVGSSGAFNLSALNGTNGFVIHGIDARDYSGWSASSAGDLNGDGVDDLIIGAPEADPGGNTSAGESYVVFGGPSVGSSGVVNLSTLNGTNGFMVNGNESGDRCGLSVASAGDVNGDGIDDVIIGAFRADANGRQSPGQSYVIFGGASIGSAGSIDPSALNGSNGFTINGVGGGDGSGYSVASAGDFNGDGVGDLIIGSYRVSTNNTASTGESYVVFGRDTSSAPMFPAALNLRTLSVTNGFAIRGIDARDYSGRSVSSAGDVNGDGFDDVIIGAPEADPNGVTDAGESYVVFGSATAGASGPMNLSELDGSNGFVLNGIDVRDDSGRSVASAGDLNNDGMDDLIIGVAHANPAGRDDAGESYVVFGCTSLGSSGALNLSALDGTNGFVLNGIDARDYCGFSVSSAGDINGDGVGDIIIGAPEADPNGLIEAGESYVVFGIDSSSEPPCSADTNNDGTLSPADFGAWIAAFNAMSPACDQNADTLCTPADFGAWIANYNAGCE